MKHSEGPFRLDVEAYSVIGCRTIIDATGQEIASTHGLHDDEEDKANALLFAASFDLLNLAKIAERHLRSEYLKLAEKYAGTPWEKDAAYIHAKEVAQNAEAIIAKATGQ